MSSMVLPDRFDAVERVLSDALSLDDASLVIYRRGVLIEFKTAMLDPGLVRTQEGPYRGWQIGPFEGHHCHVDLTSVDRVLFDAEPVSCQGGRLNYSVWFLTAGDCGNPYRPEGLLSVTLNAPYGRDGAPRAGIIEAVYALHDRHAQVPGVFASDSFVAARSAASSSVLRPDTATAHEVATG